MSTFEALLAARKPSAPETSGFTIRAYVAHLKDEPPLPPEVHLAGDFASPVFRSAGAMVRLLFAN